jgi:hypothetical protein
MTRSRLWISLAVASALAGSAAWWWWAAPGETPTDATPVATSPSAAPSAPEAAPSAPAVSYPIEAVEQALGADAGEPAPPPTLESRLAALAGAEAVGRFLVVDGFVRRVVATVDNLGRSHAPTRLWPVHPTPGRFTAEGEPDRLAVAAVNASRYEPFVRFATSVDPVRAVALYVRLYPQLQAAYEELGYPGRAFNDRVVEVIDLLLATPEVVSPLAVRLTEVRGPIPSTRPWVRYEFADSALESLPAGQKVLLRVGPAHAQALKGWLGKVRPLLAGQMPAR